LTLTRHVAFYYRESAPSVARRSLKGPFALKSNCGFSSPCSPSPRRVSLAGPSLKPAACSPCLTLPPGRLCLGHRPVSSLLRSPVAILHLSTHALFSPLSLCKSAFSLRASPVEVPLPVSLYPHPLLPSIRSSSARSLASRLSTRSSQSSLLRTRRRNITTLSHSTNNLSRLSLLVPYTNRLPCLLLLSPQWLQRLVPTMLPYRRDSACSLLSPVPSRVQARSSRWWWCRKVVFDHSTHSKPFR